MSISNKLYTAYFYLLFTLSFLALYPWFYAYLKNERWHPRANRLRRRWAKFLFTMLGIQWEISGEEELDPEEVYIFCSNHSSNLDILLSAIACPNHFRFLAKIEWSQIPVFGIFFRTVDIPIDRDNPRKALQALAMCKKSLEEGVSLVIYPEGTMKKSYGPFPDEFKSGPFRLAISSGVKVVPVTFLDNWYLFPHYGTGGSRAGKTRAVIHPPVDTREMTIEDVDKLQAEVYQTIYNSLQTYYESRSAISG